MDDFLAQWCKLNADFGLRFLENEGCAQQSVCHLIIFLFSIVGCMQLAFPGGSSKQGGGIVCPSEKAVRSDKVTRFDRNAEPVPEEKKKPKVYPKNPRAPTPSDVNKVGLPCPELNRNNRFLVFGGRGWIGSQVVANLQQNGYTVLSSRVRMQNRDQLVQEVEDFQPTHILNFAGVTGRPNVDWCESHKEETVRANVIGCLTLCDVAFERKIHVTNLATGCIYHFDEARPMGKYNKQKNDWLNCGKFHESDEPNFDGSWYSRTKGYVDRILFHAYDNVLTLRLRMPISDDLSPRNFVTKITNYQKVVNIPNSMSVLYDLIPLMLSMANADMNGLYNFTNPGVISHNQVLDLYKKVVDNDFEYKNFDLKAHNKVVVAKRSNNELTTTRLENAARELGLELPHIVQAVENSFVRSLKNYESNI